MLTRVFLSSPDVGISEISSVIGALESGWVAPAGPDLTLFESEVASFCERGFAVGVSSGTAALHLALLAAGVRQGDYVICSTLTFVATANAIRYVGAIPVFVDSDFDSGNMSTDLLEKALRSFANRKKKVGAVVPVDFLGKPADYPRIAEICGDFEIPIVSDAAESLGSKLNGRPAGSFGRLAALSFNGNKIMTTSSGGMVLTDNEESADRIRFLATQAREPFDHYEHRELGYNYRLSNILAALGRAQLRRLPEMISRRRKIRQKYRDLFDAVPGAGVWGGDEGSDNCWLSAIVVNKNSSWSPSDLQQHLEEHSIESRPLWKPMHTQPLYRGYEGFVDGTAEELFNRGLALPSGSNMTGEQWTRIEMVIRDFLLKFERSR